MDRPDRLAAYLAGTLDADERASLEAELARDGGLRADLARVRRADEALADLRTPQPPEGFEDRLDAALAGELRTQLRMGERTGEGTGERTHAGDHERPADELAARRGARGVPRWVVPVSGAAAVTVLVLAGLSVSGLLGAGGDDAAPASGQIEATLHDEEAATLFDRPADDGAADTAGAPGPDAPVVVVGDQDLGAATDADLLAVPELGEVSALALDDGEAQSLAAAWQRALLVDPDAAGDDLTVLEAVPDAADGTVDDEERPADDEAADTDVDGAGVPDETDESSDAPAPEHEPATDTTDTEAPASEDPGSLDALEAERTARGLFPEIRAAADAHLDVADERAIARCLVSVLPPGGAAIPAYVELGTLEDRPAMAIGLVTRDPGTQRATRTEVWVLARDDCQPLRFVQGG